MITKRYYLFNTGFFLPNLFYVLPLLLAAVVAAGSSLLMPSVIGTYLRFTELTNQQVSIMTSLEMLGILLTSASSFYWLKYVNYRKATLITLILLLLSNSLNMFYNTINWPIESWYLLRFVAGLATGVTYAIAVVLIAKKEAMKNIFAWLVSLQIAYGSIGFIVLPLLTAQLGLAGLYVFFNLIAVIALLSCLSRRVCATQSSANTVIKKSHKTSLHEFGLVVKVFLAIVVYYIVQGSVWAYIEPIGISKGLSALQVGTILSTGFGISIIGSLYCQKVYEKIGVARAIWLAVGLQISCLTALILPSNNTYPLITFAFATIIYQLLWSFMVPIMMKLMSASNRYKNHSALSISAFKIGLIIGPLFAAHVIYGANFNLLISIAMVGLFLSAYLLYAAVKKTNMQV